MCEYNARHKYENIDNCLHISRNKLFNIDTLHSDLKGYRIKKKILLYFVTSCSLSQVYILLKKNLGERKDKVMIA